ncbi:conserved hypothetical protein [Leishmania mexicana MHOM/GT/2001/U1103]|uniref:Uncharacterized protein n=1 Tax=Leishmania mexicana (strain MHOM/GT/2001/U1103) TaxID=929439 RepID=E9AQP5_LEIMU|nr:conserved hypothetical protein [Leishmania mexicana MHOM/GT/2001/U1103]CBZ25264.1 conserved hypothetical protein [Leishmania mexicana MHOM/GT/2001/U1103]
MPLHSKVLDYVAPGCALPFPPHRVLRIQLFPFCIPSLFFSSALCGPPACVYVCGRGWCTYCSGYFDVKHTKAQPSPRTSPHRLTYVDSCPIPRTMPVINTPFFMELRPGEELKVAQAPSAALSTSSSAASAPTTNAFAKNDFHAMVSDVAFVEEEDMDDKGAATAAATTSNPHHKHSVIRVTLLARVQPPPQGSSTEHFLKTVTLASCNFSSGPSPNGDTSNAASWTHQGKARGLPSSLPCTVTRVESTVQFRSPLFFHSSGGIQSLSVVAEDMATTAGSSGSSGSVKRYQGPRRFGVRLHGVQQTCLTKEQVLMLAQQ